MNALRLRSLNLLLASLPLCACASTPAVRALASNTGVFVQSLNSGTAEFVEAQNRLNAQNETRLVRFDGYGLRSRALVRQQRLVWTDMGSRSRLATHDLATGVEASEIVTGMAVVERQPSRVENGAASGYRATLAALADVSTTPRPLSVLGELLGFAQQVQESYDKLGEDAATAATAAGAASTSNDQAASAGAAEVANAPAAAAADPQ